MCKSALAILAAVIIMWIAGGCGAGFTPAPTSHDNNPGAIGDAGSFQIPPVPGADYSGPAFAPPKGVSSYDVHVDQPAVPDTPLAGGWTWTRYAVTYSNAGSIEPRPVSLSVTPVGSTEVWVGVSDYSTHPWHWRWYTGGDIADIELNAKDGVLAPHTYVSGKIGQGATDDGHMHIIIMAKAASAVDSVSTISVTDKTPTLASGYNVRTPQFVENRVAVGAPDNGGKQGSTIMAPDAGKVYITWDATYDPGGGPESYPSNMFVFRQEVDGSGNPIGALVPLGYVQYVAGQFVDPDDTSNPGSGTPAPGAHYVYYTYAEVPGQVRSMTDDGGPVSPPFVAPTGLTLTPPTYQDPTTDLQWTESFGATSYQIFRSDDSVNPIATVNDTNPDSDFSSWTDSNPLPGQVSSYWVKAQNSHGVSDASTSVAMSYFLWNEVDLGVGQTNTKPSLAYSGDIPIIGYTTFSAPTVDVVCAIANSADPYTDGFSTSTVTSGTTAVFNTGVAVYPNGDLLVVYAGADGIFAAVSPATNPSWTVTQIDSAAAVSGELLEVALVDDQPVVAYSDGTSVQFACISQASWTHYQLGSLSSILGLDVATVGGRPLVGIATENSGQGVVLEYSNVANPSSGDWVETIPAADTPSRAICLCSTANGLEVSLVNSSQDILVGKLDTADMTTWTSGLASPSTWSGSNATTCGLQTIGGNPVVAPFTTGDVPVYPHCEFNSTWVKWKPVGLNDGDNVGGPDFESGTGHLGIVFTGLGDSVLFDYATYVGP